MRALLLFLALSFALTGISAQAAYIQLEEEETDEIEELLKTPEEREKDKARNKAPETMEAYANRYFSGCLRQKNSLLKGEMLEMFCGCTSAKISEVMSIKQLASLSRNSEEGKFQKKRMLLFVYTPCIAYPTQAITLEQCLGGVGTTMNNPSGTCGCIAEGMGNYVKLEGPKMIERAIMFKGDQIDPLPYLLESPETQMKYKYLTKVCTAKNEG